jgi:pyruvate/2-oxoacid:ferredoxin oxidoreductase beta subunit
LTLAGLVPSLRRAHPQAVKTAAQAFSRVAWPAFGITLVTGVWNLMAVDVTTASSAYQATVLLKIAIAIASGVFAAVHQMGQTKVALAVGGALGALTAIVAMFLGVLLHTAG